MISDQEVLEIARKIEDANNIDIKKTIEKAATAGYLGEEHFYCTVIEDGGLTHTVPEILGDRYKSQPLTIYILTLFQSHWTLTAFTYP